MYLKSKGSPGRKLTNVMSPSLGANQPWVVRLRSQISLYGNPKVSTVLKQNFKNQGTQSLSPYNETSIPHGSPVRSTSTTLKGPVCIGVAAHQDIEQSID